MSRQELWDDAGKGAACQQSISTHKRPKDQVGQRAADQVGNDKGPKAPRTASPKKILLEDSNSVTASGAKQSPTRSEVGIASSLRSSQ